MKRLKNVFTIFVAVVFLLIGLYSLVYPFNEYKDLKANDETIKNIIVSDAEEGGNGEKEIAIDWEKLLGINENVIAWIYIPDTNVSYPVLQVKNNSEVIRKDLYGNYSKCGCLFVEATTQEPFNTGNTIIYGHNLNNGLMFSQLRYYSSESYMKKHSYVYVFFPDGKIKKYKVFSFEKVNANDKSIYDSGVLTETDLQNYYKNLNKSNEYVKESRIITLSTCTNNEKNTRYVVHAKEVE